MTMQPQAVARKLTKQLKCALCLVKWRDWDKEKKLGQNMNHNLRRLLEHHRKHGPVAIAVAANEVPAEVATVPETAVTTDEPKSK
jgi:hypothetical protein